VGHRHGHDLQELYRKGSSVMVQRILLKLFAAGLLSGPLKKLLERRTWKIESGEAAGLRLSFPQNLDYVHGSSELPMQICIAQHLSPGDVFYDVGANVGFFSLLAASKVGPRGSVYAFEPVSANAGVIRRNASLNAMSNLAVFEVAADEKSGIAKLYVTRWDGGSSLRAEAIATGEPREEHSVRVVALDDLVEDERLRPPTLVKIDVEGAERGVLGGMLQTIAKHKPILVYEVDDEDRVSFAHRRLALDGFVESLGYRVTHLEESYPNLQWQVGHSLALPLRVE
jgi:FkbM family methyltransferase